MSDVDHDGHQPLASPDKATHRQYIPATWSARGAGGGHPKLSGGETINSTTGGPAPRAFNRPNQVYAQSAVTLEANRAARAVAELDSTVVLQAEPGQCLLQSAEGNRYQCEPGFPTCNCGDRFRLDQSGHPSILCKHERMALAAATAAGGIANLPWSTITLAAYIGCELRTAERLCEEGTCPATKVSDLWAINPADGQASGDTYQANIWPYT